MVSESGRQQVDGNKPRGALLNQSTVSRSSAKLHMLRQNLAACETMRSTVGSVNPRGAGRLNAAIQLVKTLMHRALGWYLRPTAEFHEALLDTLNQTAAVLEEIQAQLNELDGGRLLESTSTVLIPPSESAQSAPAMSTVPELGVNIAGYIGSEKGVGEAMRAHIRSLVADGLPHAVNNFQDTGSRNLECDIPVREDNPYPVNLLMVNADQVPRFARQRPGFLSGHCNIGGWNWELSTFPREWANACYYFDEIWAPTAFVRDSIAAVSTVPVHTIPYSLSADLAIDSQWTRSRFGLPDDTFIFLFLFDYQSSVERKNPLALVQAFKQAFGSSRQALLLIKGAHSHFAREQKLEVDGVLRHSARALADAGKGANVRLLDTVLPRKALTALMSLCNCYVSLHRAEGFGFTMAEAMALGKPVIATGYSGNMDFMTPANSFLVDYQLVEIVRGSGPYREGNVWVEPDVNHAADLMRHVFDNRSAAAAVAAKGRSDITAQLSPQRIGALMRKRLQEALQPSSIGASR